MRQGFSLSWPRWRCRSAWVQMSSRNAGPRSSKSSVKQVDSGAEQRTTIEAGRSVSRSNVSRCRGSTVKCLCGISQEPCSLDQCLLTQAPPADQRIYQQVAHSAPPFAACPSGARSKYPATSDMSCADPARHLPSVSPTVL